MTTLKTNFVEGDILTAGLVSSTSSLNGITTTVNSNTINKIAFIGHSTLSSKDTFTTESIIGSVLIPANTIGTGLTISSAIRMRNSSGGTASLDFRLKTGTEGSETAKDTQNYAVVNGNFIGGAFDYYESSLNWSNPQVVLITVQSDTSNAATIGYCHGLTVKGN